MKKFRYQTIFQWFYKYDTHANTIHFDTYLAFFCLYWNTHDDIWSTIKPIISVVSKVSAYLFNKWRPTQSGCHFADEFWNSFCCLILISLKGVSRSPNCFRQWLRSEYILIRSWCRRGDNLLSEPMRASLPTKPISVTRPRWWVWCRCRNIVSRHIAHYSQTSFLTSFYAYHLFRMSYWPDSFIEMADG